MRGWDQVVTPGPSLDWQPTRRVARTLVVDPQTLGIDVACVDLKVTHGTTALFAILVQPQDAQLWLLVQNVCPAHDGGALHLKRVPTVACTRSTLFFQPAKGAHAVNPTLAWHHHHVVVNLKISGCTKSGHTGPTASPYKKKPAS